MSIKLSALAEELGLEYTGADIEISGVNTLDKAGPDEISFLVNPKYQQQLETTKAGCVLTSGPYAERVRSALVSTNVYMDLAKIINLFAKPQGCLTGVSELAFIHPDASVDGTATVYPFAFIGEGAEIGSNTVLFPGVYVGEGTRVGANCILYPNVVVMGGLSLGDNVILQPGAVLGGDGFGFAQTPAGHMKIPQIGTVAVEDDVEIGANSAIDRAALDTTRIKRGTKIDNLVQIGHNVEIGEHCLIVGLVGIGGSTVVGNGVILAGQAGVADNTRIGDGVIVGGQCGVSGKLEPGVKVSGTPAMPYATFLKAAGVCVPKLPDMFKRLKKLEMELESMKKAVGEDNE
ncbi:UDP-3-O-(3-hydroxymyristoyl)glucosamine N-acyltransferase [Pseudodesulfovibrio portus]|uniref:UDP-3-O-acylglucosamine N-acyltransferase n=1 Tax=Pseudodesulfovibrio portus TaxID=231439 RepID=A0ABN6RPR1_9BACT|nr:UDP-3-O-(3-hydroxymyristoyl)glucosamine N-acyltransferase [Pseudodesulfovibrio portus]BDQ32835.1 UDP-3-O-acylglucosamine N-acyltransferase [Pseudodesulfovibrio portus]